MATYQELAKAYQAKTGKSFIGLKKEALEKALSGKIIEVGMGASMGYGADSYPYTIHKVSKDGKRVWASADKYKYNKEAGDYDYSNDNQNDESQWLEFTLRKDDRFHQVGQSVKSSALHIGRRRYYQDPSF